ncbi:hypothetical protein L228DRAFT_264798 [Xylona heveae TC161]|uniref:C2H2-type domain-containing protein n=1 Tax=Xylona heveae (strain CBS 132557 / TC161) TaxID=1328760 RepID=A0A165JLQ3_XYLHT|nr:hypothetical protein L228DRAFT_264798 [Xylona heveae TC161]KZF26398.1 hypothetical protein L228DRAFT_264798 [Xylona heveae TC161]
MASAHDANTASQHEDDAASACSATCSQKTCSNCCDEDHCEEDHCKEDHCKEDHCEEDHCEEDHCEEDHCSQSCEGFVKCSEGPECDSPSSLVQACISDSCTVPPCVSTACAEETCASFAPPCFDTHCAYPWANSAEQSPSMVPSPLSTYVSSSQTGLWTPVDGWLRDSVSPLQQRVHVRGHGEMPTPSPFSLEDDPSGLALSYDPYAYPDAKKAKTSHNPSEEVATYLLPHSLPETQTEQHPTSLQPTSNPSFLCLWGNSCGEEFFDFNALEDHVQHNHVRPQTVFNCEWDSCGQVTASSDLLSHVRHSHAFADEHICLWAGCEAKFYRVEDLEEHVKIAHVPQNALYCQWDHCGILADGPANLSNHLQTNHLIGLGVDHNTQQTHFCTHSHSHNQNHLYQHQHFHHLHGHPRPDDQTYVLKEDSFPRHKPISSRSQSTPLESQNPVVPSEDEPEEGDDKSQVRICSWSEKDGSTCNQTFDSVRDLHEHVKEHHVGSEDSREDGYVCRWAGCSRMAMKPFKQKGKLERHIQVHTRLKNCQCQFCGKEFSAQQALAQHERTHTGEKPFLCEYCGKGFAQSSALTMHKRTHTNEKPLKCDFPGCNKTFSESSNLSKHKKTHSKLPREHRCTFPGCDKSFHRFDQLKRHRKVHEKKRQLTDVSGSDTSAAFQIPPYPSSHSSSRSASGSFEPLDLQELR